MKTTLRKLQKTGVFLLVFALILLYPHLSLYYAATGLTLWLDCMVPALLPFMILSGIMVRQNLSESFAGMLYPVFTPFKISRNCVYCMILGFLCGFPMGARTTAQLYERNELTKKEAAFLLAFTNNLGPVYYVTFLLPTIGLYSFKKMPILLFGMYGIPLFYGLFIRYSGFLLPKGSFCNCSHHTGESENFTDSIGAAMENAISGITTLGGYMILFNLFNLIPHALLSGWDFLHKEQFLSFTNCLFEITSGVSRIGTSSPLPVLFLLPLGGLSCLAQTAAVIKDTDLSMKNYLLHKGVQTLLTLIYYLLFFRLL